MAKEIGLPVEICTICNKDRNDMGAYAKITQLMAKYHCKGNLMNSGGRVFLFPQGDVQVADQCNCCDLKLLEKKTANFDGLEVSPLNRVEKLPDKIVQWRWFSPLVEKHIYQYVVTQYGGDLPDEHIESMSIEQIKGKMSSYVQRIGVILKTRGKKDAARDILKIAHFCCYQLEKMVKEYDLKPEDFELELFED